MVKAVSFVQYWVGTDGQGNLTGTLAVLQRATVVGQVIPYLYWLSAITHKRASQDPPSLITKLQEI